MSRAEGLLKQLEQEVAELKRREAELEQLSHTEDHIHFLQVTSLSIAAGVSKGKSLIKLFESINCAFLCYTYAKTFILFY